MASKWVVDIKGKAGSETFEISVLRDDNTIGKSSYGWIGKNKLLITQNNGHTPLIESVWNKSVSMAHEVAAELNEIEDASEDFVSHYTPLFEYLANEHNLILLDSELEEIISIVKYIEINND